MELSTTRFGTIDIEEGDIFTFSDGLYAYHHLRQFVLIRHSEESPFLWLQSVEEGDTAFLLMDPWDFCLDYEVELPDSDVEALLLSEDKPKWVYVIVNIPPGKPHAMTTNLLAPLIINGADRLGRQVVLDDERYSTRHPVLSEMWRTVQQSQAAG